MSRLRPLAAALTLGLCTLLVPLAHAWTFTYAEPFPDGPVPIAFGITPALPGNVPATDWENALRAAAVAWNNSLQRIQLDVRPTTDTAWYENGQNEVFFDKDMFDDPFPSGVLAVTAYTHDRGTRVETDIVVNRAWNWSVYAGPIRSNPVDLRRVLIHELGHFLGLDHPDEAGQSVPAIMNSSVSNVEALTADDIAGAGALYDLGRIVPPIVVFETGNLTATQGTRTSLRVLAGGRRPFRYEWRRNGVLMPSATSDTLSFSAVRLDEAGDYTVNVANQAGSVASKPMRLTVSPATPPSGQILQGPRRLTVGKALFLSVSPQGHGPMRYEWRKNGVPLTGSDGPALTIEDMQLSDAGNYTVTLSNAAGSYTTPATLVEVVRSFPLRFLHNLPDQAIVAGGTLRLEVPIYVGYAADFTFQWQKDGVNIPGATNFTFVISWFRPEDAGRYRVVMANAYGSTASNEASVACYGGPALRILKQPGSAATEEGGEANFVVLPQDPSLSYQWYRNGQPIPSSPYHRGVNGASLQIRPVDFSDAGIYVAEVSDGTRRLRTQEASLEVRTRLSAPPAFRQHPESATILSGAETMLYCISGVSSASFQWYKNGQPLAGQKEAHLWFRPFTPSDVGTYTVAVSQGSSQTMSKPATLDMYGEDAPLILKHPTDVVLGSIFPRFFVTTSPGSPGRLQYQWYRNGTRIENAKGDFLDLSIGDPLFEGAYYVVVTDGQRTETSRPAQARKPAISSAPEILSQPTDAISVRGGEAFFGVNADGAPFPLYQWYRNGVAIPGATDLRLRLRDVQATDEGVYTVTVFNSVGSVTSRPAALAIDGRGRLINLATRARVGRGDDVLIAGFTISGTEPRQVLVRGIGDQLSEFGVSGVLRDPVLKIFDGQGKELASNDDWFRLDDTKVAELKEAARQVGAFPQRDNARDATLLQTLPPGSYTAQVSGLVNTTGVGLVEIYELGKPGKGRLINLSSRAVVGTGDNILIPGLVLQGTAPRRLLIRAVGPGLAALGVMRALADPQLKVFRGDGRDVGENNNWGEQAGGGAATAVSLIAASTTAVGAFPLAAGSKDAAVLLDLPAGSYTIQVSGVNNTEGIALVEVYEVP